MDPYGESITFLTGGCIWPLFNQIAADCLDGFLVCMAVLALILVVERRKTKLMRAALNRECD